jgi:HEAT repeat protein
MNDSDFFEEIEKYMLFLDNNSSNSIRLDFFDKIIHEKDGIKKLILLIFEYELDNDEVDYIFGLIDDIEHSSIPIYEILELLGHNNAFVRNRAISSLQYYDDHIMYFIVKSLISKDRDIRILALNVLGGVTFDKRRDFIMELLEKEQDLNVAMTAVDYLGEIGKKEDISLLNELKTRFNNDHYVTFAINRAVTSITGEC